MSSSARIARPASEGGREPINDASIPRPWLVRLPRASAAARSSSTCAWPRARGTERLWRDLRDDLRRLGLVFEWAPTTGPGSATDLARAAADRGLGLVVAVGGDGTLNEVVNGAVADDRPRPSVGAILTGRGRDAA